MSTLRRLPTGVAGLDRMLQGGIPQGACVLVVGPPGSGKSTLGRQFLFTAATNGWDAFALSTSDSSELILQSMASFGWDLKKSGRIDLIDAYSWRQGIPSALDLTRLTEVSIAISRFIDKPQRNNTCFVLDSFTDFLLNNQAEAALRFLSQLKSRLQAKNTTALVLLEEGPHSANIVSTAEYLNDGTVRTKYDESGRYIMVSRMLATPVQLGWSEFTIQKGIDVVVRDFFGGGTK